MYYRYVLRHRFIRTGVTAMKKARLAAESLADRLDLPQDALLGSGKLTVTAGRQVFIENHCGILEYGTERICVAFDRGRVVINGTGLELVAMSGRELIIKGRLHSLEWE